MPIGKTRLVRRLRRSGQSLLSLSGRKLPENVFVLAAEPAAHIVAGGTKGADASEDTQDVTSTGVRQSGGSGRCSRRGRGSRLALNGDLLDAFS